MRQTVIGVLTLVLAVATGCGGSSREAADPSSPSTAVTSPATSPAYTTLSGALGRCGPQPVETARAGFDYRVVGDRKVGRVPVVTAGRGSTVAVLLHETDGNGLCGWLAFAARLVKDRSVSVVAVDLCGYGDADCRPRVQASDAASLAIDVARRDLDARRVVVVGASMGGSIALITSVRDRRVDAVADLSGPIDWPGMEVVRGGRALSVPVLVAMADSEAAADVTGSRELVAHAPPGSKFVAPSSGHGYELLLDDGDHPGPMAAPLFAWIKGQG